MVPARVVTMSFAALICALLVAPAARAQQASGIAGVVRDTSGAVLPGVTVEAASPVLIEQVRTIVTDGEGRYGLIDLRPGTYSIAFTLPGFSTFRREGVALTAGFTATVNAEMRVGSLEETITVTGAAPLVDTQNVRTQSVVTKQLLEALPSGNMGMVSFITLTPGLSGPADVGGSLGAHRSMSGQTTAYRGRSSGKINFDGMGVLNMNTEGNASYIVNAALVEEMVLETGGISAESSASGFAFNAVPKEGSNAFRIIATGLYTNGSLQSDNSNAALRARGIAVDKVAKIYDGAVTVGGALKRNSLWFFGGYRAWGNQNWKSGIFWNKTQGTPFFTPDLDRPGDRIESYRSYSGRLTWQVSPRNKLNFFADVQNNCVCRGLGNSAPEAESGLFFWPQGLYQTRWTLPLTARLLIDTGASATISRWPNDVKGPLQAGVKPTDIAILELSTNFRYNAANQYRGPENSGDRYAAQSAVSYVTGAHTVKIGFQLESGIRDVRYLANGNVEYAFLNGAPNRITQRTTPYLTKQRMRADLGIYAQDQWIVKRLSLNYGLRFDYFNGRVLEQYVPATPFIPERHYAPVYGAPSWKDLNPRVGGSYDLFGTGRTALKVSLGRYVGKTATGIPEAVNPITTSVNAANRTWNDTNRNYIPDCNLTNFAANGECGAINNQNFGKSSPDATRWADDVLRGFGVRDFNWDVTTEIQQELRSGLSVTGGYYRNASGNFRVTDNLAVTPADHDQFCITAPIDARLPGGGGYQVCGLYDVKPAKFGQVTNLVTQASHFGGQTRVSDFFGVSFRMRTAAGIQFGGGVDTGRIVNDRCFVIDSPQELLYCHVVTSAKANTQIKFNGSIPLPRDFALSGTFQNVAGPSYGADYPAPNAEIAPFLGRNLAACGSRAVCTSTATVPLIPPETYYEARRTQLDLRLSKMLNLGPKIRLRANLDLYNALNANSILGLNNTYGPRWLDGAGGAGSGTSVLDGRLLQVGGQLTF